MKQDERSTNIRMPVADVVRIAGDANVREFIELKAAVMNDKHITVHLWRKWMVASIAQCGHHEFIKRGLSLLLARGEMMEPILRPKGMRKRKDGQCFLNALRTRGKYLDLSYVEGYAITGGALIHHAWCATPEHKAIDPTWRELGVSYFGVRFTPQEIAERLQMTRAFSMFEMLL